MIEIMIVYICNLYCYCSEGSAKTYNAPLIPKHYVIKNYAITTQNPTRNALNFTRLHQHLNCLAARKNLL